MLSLLQRLRCASAALLFAVVWATPATCHAGIGLVVGEPFGAFGTMMPQGHASIYLDHLCADTPVHLRPCLPGEHGAVLSRYHDVRKPALDWLAFPATTFFYGVDDVSALPRFITPQFEALLRERYWSEHLREVLPGRRDRNGEVHMPHYGDWQEGIAASFDRRLLVYMVDTTPEQDAALLTLLNESPNRRRYTLARANCADFAAGLLRLVLPATVVRRNVPADFDMTTPKNLARQVDAYGNAHPELHLRVLEFPQIPGSLRRSRPLRGAAESLLTTRRYLATLLLIQPEVVIASWAMYEKRGKWKPGTDAVAITPADWMLMTPHAAEVQSASTGSSSSDGASSADAP